MSYLLGPQRFLERKFGPFEFLPFGGGHRRCIGAAFALYEMKIALWTLVMSDYDLEIPEPEEKTKRRSLTLGPAKGVPVRVIKRAG